MCDDESKITLLAYLQAKTGELNEELPSLQELWKIDQYFNSLYYKNENASYDEPVLVDCGAYDGDSCKDFFKFTENKGHAYALEPDEENYRKLESYAKEEGKILPIRKGVWNKETTLSFNDNGRTDACLSEGNIGSAVEVTSIDNINFLDHVPTFIKMDIEGSEAEALKGAKNTISVYMPFLAICAYHKIDDLLVLPKLIMYLSRENREFRYSFYLRIHSALSQELVLYAVPTTK